MLSERVEITEKGFKVKPDTTPGSEGRRAFYSYFELKNPPGDVLEEKEVKYWDPLNGHIEEVKKRTFIRVVEKNEDETVDSYAFFFSHITRRETLNIRTKREPRYGRRSYLISIEWEEGRAEAISCEYIYLRGRQGEKYHFMRDIIYPMIPDAKKPMDKYVYTVPEGDNPQNYYVEVDPLVKAKYRVTFE